MCYVSALGQPHARSSRQSFVRDPFCILRCAASRTSRWHPSDRNRLADSGPYASNLKPALAADGPTVAHKAERQLVLPHSILSTSISPMLAIPSCLPCNNCKWCVDCCSKNYMVVWMCALGVELATADAMLPVEPACAAVERDTQNVASC